MRPKRYTAQSSSVVTGKNLIQVVRIACVLGSKFAKTRSFTSIARPMDACWGKQHNSSGCYASMLPA